MARVRHVPERRCVACNEKVPKRQLFRIVRSPEGTVSADSTGKASGRGAYLCSSAGCWEKGVRKGALERSLQVAIAPRERQLLLDFFLENVAQATAVEG